MPYNLLEQQWIPVVRNDGSRHWIRPSEITSDYDTNPIMRVDSNRADFNGALLQFLIGLLQTCSAPEKPDDPSLKYIPWQTRFKTPPSTEELQVEFDVYKDAFNLDGEYPRFMQDATVQDGGAIWTINKLLIDGFGASDHFGKFDSIKGIGYRSLAMAIISHQINTTSSAAGAQNQHRSSLRNAGFLTTIIGSNKQNLQKGTLWETLWLNVLPTIILNSVSGNPDKTEIKHIFPWMGSTRLSHKNGGIDTTPEDVNPLMMFWATPRRVHVDFDVIVNGLCAIEPKQNETLVTTFLVKPDGNNYSLWKHTLTPTRCDENNMPTSFFKTDRNGVRYSDWLGIISNARFGESTLQSADVVKYYNLETEEVRDCRNVIAPNTRIIAFGFMNDNAKILTYRFNEMPLYYIPNDVIENTNRIVERIVQSSSATIKKLRDAIKAYDNIKHYKFKDNKWQWISNKQKSSKESSLVAGAEQLFWNNTEKPFYEIVPRIIETLKQNNNTTSPEIVEIKHEWRKILADTALGIFKQISKSAPLEQCDMPSIMRAELELAWFVNLVGKQNDLRDILGIERKIVSSTGETQ
jgi:CRISPR system Cascade subunit CasA